MRHNVYTMVMDRNSNTITKVRCDLLVPLENDQQRYPNMLYFNIFFDGLSNHPLWCHLNGNIEDCGYDGQGKRVAYGLSINKMDALRDSYIKKGYRTI